MREEDWWSGIHAGEVWNYEDERPDIVTDEEEWI